MDNKPKGKKCIHRNPRDRSRCKMTVSGGNKFCHHHRYDLRAIANDASACIDIFAKHFPKNHHPACDRKSENDCDCPAYSRGAHAMMTLQAGFKQSTLHSPLYAEHLRLTMAQKVRRIGKYYRSITEEDLYLPPDSRWRQFRFFVWDKKDQQIRVKVIRDIIRDKSVLLRHLRKLKPLTVYYTCGKWLNPTQIGPDPNGRYGIRKFIEKKWCTKNDTVTLKRYHDTLLKKDLYFDVDYDNKDYNEGIKMVQRTIDLLMSMKKMGRYTLPDLTESDIDIVFSGGKGFHVIVNGFYDMVMVGDKPFTEYVNTPDKNRMIQEFYQEIVDEMRALDPGLLLDFMVTYDNRRIIRLPGTVHQKTLRVCKLLAGIGDERIIKDSNGKMIGYNADPAI